MPGTLWSEIEEFQFPTQSQQMIDTLFSAVMSKSEDAKAGGADGNGTGTDLDGTCVYMCINIIYLHMYVCVFVWILGILCCICSTISMYV